MNARTIGVALCLAVTSSVAAHAQTTQAGAQASPLGWYAGGNVGGTKGHVTTTPPTGVIYNSVSEDNWDTGFKIFGGYQFHPNFAVELGYMRPGNFGFTATSVPAGSINSTYKNDGWTLDLVPIIPIANRFSFFGRLGAYYNETKVNISGTGPIVSQSRSERNWNWNTGLGLQYDLTPVVGVRFEIDPLGRLGPANERATLYSLGLIYRFGM